MSETRALKILINFFSCKWFTRLLWVLMVSFLVRWLRALEKVLLLYPLFQRNFWSGRRDLGTMFWFFQLCQFALLVLPRSQRMYLPSILLHQFLKPDFGVFAPTPRNFFFLFSKSDIKICMKSLVINGIFGRIFRKGDELVFVHSKDFVAVFCGDIFDKFCAYFFVAEISLYARLCFFLCWGEEWGVFGAGIERLWGKKGLTIDFWGIWDMLGEILWR